MFYIRFQDNLVKQIQMAKFINKLIALEVVKWFNIKMKYEDAFSTLLSHQRFL